MEPLPLPLSPAHRFMRRVVPIVSAVILVVAFFGALMFSYLAKTPSFDPEIQVMIPEGASLTAISEILKDAGVIRSAGFLRVQGRLIGTEAKAGVYAFSVSSTTGRVLSRLDAGDYGDVYVSVTIPEGSTNRQIAAILAKSDLNLDETTFLELAEGKEGYLFPDTYRFLPGTDEEEVIEILEETFTNKTKELVGSVGDRSWDDIVIMASLLEKESGRNPEEQRTIAGILWKRLDRGIALQVDAPFLYILGRGSADLTTTDLRADGPYNTYTRLGLTPTPIGNPGLATLEAALKPTPSLYFFYLHDTNGDIHYGVTHDDHVRNKHQYL